MRDKSTLYLWLPSILWVLFIFALSSMPGADFSPNPQGNFVIRKVLHIVEYFILTFCFFRGSKRVTFSVIFAILVAFSDEYHQTFIPTRTGKISDILIDIIGILISGFILWKYIQYLPHKLKNWLLESPKN